MLAAATRVKTRGRAFVAGATLRFGLGRPRLHNGPAARAGQCREGNQPMAQPDSKANEEAHWQKTTRLMFTHLGVWFFFGYVVHMFVVPLNKIIIPVLGFPLGFYMAAQGSLIVFVVMLFMFAKQQDKIDRESRLRRRRLREDQIMATQTTAALGSFSSSSAGCTAPIPAASSDSSSCSRFSSRSACRTRSSAICSCSSRSPSTPSSA